MDNSRFADLPAELRNEIWELAMDPNTPVGILAHPNKLVFTNAKTKYALPHTCKQIRAEALAMFYAQQEFRVRTWQFSSAGCPGLAWDKHPDEMVGAACKRRILLAEWVDDVARLSGQKVQRVTLNLGDIGAWPLYFHWGSFRRAWQGLEQWRCWAKDVLPNRGEGLGMAFGVRCKLGLRGMAGGGEVRSVKYLIGVDCLEAKAEFMARSLEAIGEVGDGERDNVVLRWVATEWTSRTRSLRTTEASSSADEFFARLAEVMFDECWGGKALG